MTIEPLSRPAATARAPHWEWRYLDLMRRIWTQGDERVDRTGIGTRSLFGETIRFDLSGGAMPLLTTKRVYWKTATRELLWFLTGDTNIRALCAQGVEIWTDWPLDRYRRETGDDIARADFSRRIVEDEAFAEQWGDLGPVYGKQWVDWPTYESAGEEGLFRRGPGVNQVTQVLQSLKTNPGSRRHIIEGWNVAELDAMALPPCHKTYQFHVANGRLSCALYQRSCDLGLGFAFNMWSLALLTRVMAHQCDLEPGEAVWMGGDVHLYLNHAALVEEQLSREPAGEAHMRFGRRPASIFDYRIEDFEVSGYAPQTHIAAPVAV
ncbi:thymidylate synthase [Novosphingobium sp. Rr 2-17]|uniref:thymidylate synthase n=1 Tax=Novosphingobium sp. Rr 2-17 TaxID=555793 RepID=UPI0002698E9F|nr:thymidylate synthase [Novosphingobium sp. Rr 2-17]EIZ80627.1 thymidylate synthase [Novosphingobium sp. Rr 2-17]